MGGGTSKMVEYDTVCISLLGGSSEIGGVVCSSLRKKGFNVICSYFSKKEHSSQEGWLYCDVTSNESVYETYYNFAVNDTLTITPSLQYVVHPGGGER